MRVLSVVANLLVALAVLGVPAAAQILSGKLRLNLLSSAVGAGQFVPVGDSGGAEMTTPIGGGYRLSIFREGSLRRDCPSWYITVRRDRSDEDWLRPRPPSHGSNWRNISAPNHEMHGDVRRFWLGEPPTEVTLQLHGVVTRGEGLGACFAAGYAEISWTPLPRLPREALEGIWRRRAEGSPPGRGFLGDGLETMHIRFWGAAGLMVEDPAERNLQKIEAYRLVEQSGWSVPLTGSPSNVLKRRVVWSSDGRGFTVLTGGATRQERWRLSPDADVLTISFTDATGVARRRVFDRAWR
jgi:hypothetical protein